MSLSEASAVLSASDDSSDAASVSVSAAVVAAGSLDPQAVSVNAAKAAADISANIVFFIMSFSLNFCVLPLSYAMHLLAWQYISTLKFYCKDVY